MLLLLTGMATDLPVVRRLGRAAVNVSIAGVSLPFACGFAPGEVLPETTVAGPRSAFDHLVVPRNVPVNIVAMGVRDMNIMRRTVGQVIVAAAMIDDTIGSTVIVVTFSLASTGG